MVRKKTSLVPIAESSYRNATYKKRKETLIRKTSELSELCGNEACVIIYGPKNHEPDVWPSHDKTRQILSRFSNAPEIQRNRNMIDQKGIIYKQVEKLQVELQKVEEENHRLESTILLHDVLSMQCTLSDVADAEKLWSMSAMVEARLNEVREKMNEQVPVPKPVGPLKEVLLHGPLNWPRGADMALPSREQFNFAPKSVGPLEEVLLHGPLNWLRGADMALPSQEQFNFAPKSVGPLEEVLLHAPLNWPQDMQCRDQYIVGLESADVAPMVQNRFLFAPASVDKAPLLLDEQFSLPNLCTVVGTGEKANEPESADVAAKTWGPPPEEDDISKFLDSSCSSDIWAFI